MYFGLLAKCQQGQTGCMCASTLISASIIHNLLAKLHGCSSSEFPSGDRPMAFTFKYVISCLTTARPSANNIPFIEEIHIYEPETCLSGHSLLIIPAYFRVCTVAPDVRSTFPVSLFLFNLDAINGVCFCFSQSNYTSLITGPVVLMSLFIRATSDNAPRPSETTPPC